jgi:hypothetical protein
MPGVLCGETEEVGRGEYRSRHVAEPNQLVAGEQPSRPRFFESRPLRSGGGNSDGGGEALRALRNWIEQSYKQVKNALGWAHYQVRKNISIRRHWQMVCCAFTFCWWEGSDLLEAETSPGVRLQAKEPDPASENPKAAGRGKKERPSIQASGALVATRAAKGEGMAGTIRDAHALLWRAFWDLPPPEGLKALLERVFSGEGLYLYAH